MAPPPQQQQPQRFRAMVPVMAAHQRTPPAAATPIPPVAAFTRSLPTVTPHAKAPSAYDAAQAVGPPRHRTPSGSAVRAPVPMAKHLLAPAMRLDVADDLADFLDSDVDDIVDAVDLPAPWTSMAAVVPDLGPSRPALRAGPDQWNARPSQAASSTWPAITPIMRLVALQPSAAVVGRVVRVSERRVFRSRKSAWRPWPYACSRLRRRSRALRAPGRRLTRRAGCAGMGGRARAHPANEDNFVDRAVFKDDTGTVLVTVWSDGATAAHVQDRLQVRRPRKQRSAPPSFLFPHNLTKSCMHTNHARPAAAGARMATSWGSGCCWCDRTCALRPHERTTWARCARRPPSR